jgi:hypothetical protein
MNATITTAAPAQSVAPAQPAGNNNVTWNLAIPAGQTALIPQTGTFYEFLVATGRVAIRSGNNSFSGQYNDMQAGWGNRDLTFTKLEIQNLETFPVIISVVVGTGAFINRQLVLASNSTPDIVYPTYPIPLAATRIDIPDLSGTAFTDLDGNKWLAIQRVAILIFNQDSGTYNLLEYGSTNPSSKSVAVIPPKPLPLKLEFAGNFSIYTGGSDVNMVVSEIYQSIPASVITE